MSFLAFFQFLNFIGLCCNPFLIIPLFFPSPSHQVPVSFFSPPDTRHPFVSYTRFPIFCRSNLGPFLRQPSNVFPLQAFEYCAAKFTPFVSETYEKGLPHFVPPNDFPPLSWPGYSIHPCHPPLNSFFLRCCCHKVTFSYKPPFPLSSIPHNDPTFCFRTRLCPGIVHTPFSSFFPPTFPLLFVSQPPAEMITPPFSEYGLPHQYHSLFPTFSRPLKILPFKPFSHLPASPIPWSTNYTFTPQPSTDPFLTLVPSPPRVFLPSFPYHSAGPDLFSFSSFVPPPLFSRTPLPPPNFLCIAPPSVPPPPPGTESTHPSRRTLSQGLFFEPPLPVVFPKGEVTTPNLPGSSFKLLVNLGGAPFLTMNIVVPTRKFFLSRTSFFFWISFVY